jgi:hypothetical protein
MIKIKSFFWPILIFWALVLDFGKIEGTLFPVVNPAYDIVAISDGKGGTILSGKFYKNRMCSPLKMDWKKGARGDEITPPIRVVWGKPVTRLDGTQEFHGWVLNAEPDVVLNDSFSDVLHKCSFLGFEVPWETRTKFYK